MTEGPVTEVQSARPRFGCKGFPLGGDPSADLCGAGPPSLSLEEVINPNARVSIGRREMEGEFA